MRTYWLSFCDNDKPKGEQFLGACVLDISDEEAAAMLPDLNGRFPNHADGAEWIAAASAKAWALGCNPGGEMLSADISNGPADKLASLRRGVLLSKADIEDPVLM